MFADTPEYQAAPLIIWLQGGPGASSTGFGNFAEIGPQDVRLLPRNHSWVRFANLLFVDNPVGSGYSFVTNETGFAVNNSQIASDLVAMISVFLAKMPEFQASELYISRLTTNVPLYIFSESYGGKMAAEFALQLYKSFLDKTNLMTLNKVVSEIRQALVAKDGAEATALWASAEDIVEQLTNGIDWYNILQPQQESSASLGVLSLPSDNTLGRAFVRHVAHFYNVFNGTLTELMNGPIKEKLGSIPKNVTWGGTLQWMEQLKWPGMKEFQATSKKPMVVEGETAGYYKSFKNLTLYWVLKAGHMVPADAPLAAQSMARHITTGKW
ncbi:hypothetical protein HPB52_002027 [Rhipicephalus sanguineus]|uniref:Carboxypeptidase n=1 Tax=Rhipicephalus sanguineus TaxID=34632 RepID=A0A9D4SQ10_RHISA|nr:hypothetical protein HPB52_002027 [Rhipicephalus sanguineus]